MFKFASWMPKLEALVATPASCDNANHVVSSVHLWGCCQKCLEMHLLQRFPMEKSDVYRQKLIKGMCKTFSLTVLPAQAAPAKAFLGRSTAMLKHQY